MAKWRNTTYTDFTPNDVPQKETFWEKEATLTRVIVVRNATPEVRYQAYRDFMGTSNYVSNVLNTGTGKNMNYVSRTPPHGLPSPFLTANGRPFLYATRIADTELLGLRGTDKNGLAIYDAVRITIQYGQLPWDVLDDDAVRATPVGGVPFPLPNLPSPLYDTAAQVGYPDEGQAVARGTGRMGGGSRWIARNNRPSSKILTVPLGLLWYVPLIELGETKPFVIKEGLPFEEVRIELKYTQMEVPYQAYPLNAILNGMNTINSEYFDGYPGNPSGTLMLRYVEPKWYQRYGEWMVDIEYGFGCSPHINPAYKDFAGVTQPAKAYGWNYFLGKGGKRHGAPVIYRNVTSDGDPNSPQVFRSTNFADLFRPDQPI